MSISITFTELTIYSDKKKWWDRFSKSYKKGKAYSAAFFNSTSRYFLATDDQGNELGFIRISDKSHFFKKNGKTVWCAQDMYVKPKYRSQGVAKALLQYVISNCEVKIGWILEETYKKCSGYYNALGFTYAQYNKPGEDLLIMVQSSFVNEFKDR